MDMIALNVRDIAAADRAALEHVVGAPLGENQRVTINIENIEAAPAATLAGSASAVALPDWCDVYAGLSEAEIDRLDQATKPRLDLTRGGG